MNDTPMPSLYEKVKNNLIFSHLDSYSFRIVENYLLFRGLEAGHYLFHEGEHGDFVAFVLVGQLQVLKQNSQGQSIVLATIGSGDSIGEMAIIDELSRSASVKAIEKTALLVLPKRDFESILLDHPRIGVEMLRGLAVLLSLNLRRTSDAILKGE